LHLPVKHGTAEHSHRVLAEEPSYQVRQHKQHVGQLLPAPQVNNQILVLFA
jgi:hypothetical protein